LEIPKDYLQLDAVNDCLKRHCKKYALVRYKIFTGERKSHLLLYEYKLKLKDKKGGSDFSDALKALENVDVASLEFRKAAVENI
jgi:hypothetical protein